MSDQADSSAGSRIGRRHIVALALLISGVVLLVDQATKFLVEQHADALPLTLHALGCDASISLQRNSGAFLSLGSTLGEVPRLVLFSVLPVTASLVSLGYALTRRPIPLLQRTCAALIAAGAAGNFIDRVARGGLVTDFLFLGCGPLHTGVFNVADMALTTSAIVVALEMVLRPREVSSGPAIAGDA